MVVSLLIVTAFVLRRNSRPREVNLQRLWIRPLIAFIGVVVLFSQSPPPLNAASVAVVTTGIALGAALGWQRGRLTLIEVHPETHVVTARVSPLGVILVLGLVALRMILRTALSGPEVDAHLVGLLADGLMVMAAVTMVAQQIEIGSRARRLQGEAKTLKTKI
jgi:hypothetical protein